MTEAVVVYVLKQILHATSMALEKDYSVKLNLRVGFMKFRRNHVAFENMPKQSDLSVATSCASSFVRNKAHLTTLRSPRVNASLKDALSLGGLSTVTSVCTPRTYATSVSTRHNLVSPRASKNLQPAV